MCIDNSQDGICHATSNRIHGSIAQPEDVINEKKSIDDSFFIWTQCAWNGHNIPPVLSLWMAIGLIRTEDWKLEKWIILISMKFINIEKLQLH